MGVAVPTTSSRAGTVNGWKRCSPASMRALKKNWLPISNSFTMRKPLVSVFSARTVWPDLRQGEIVVALHAGAQTQDGARRVDVQTRQDGGCCRCGRALDHGRIFPQIDRSPFRRRRR